MSHKLCIALAKPIRLSSCAFYQKRHDDPLCKGCTWYKKKSVLDMALDPNKRAKSKSFVFHVRVGLKLKQALEAEARERGILVSKLIKKILLKDFGLSKD